MDELVRAESSKPEERDISKPKLLFGESVFPEKGTIRARIATLRGKGHISRTVCATVKPPSHYRWDYRAETAVDEDDERLHTGVCIRAQPVPDGSLDLTMDDFTWRLANTKIKSVVFFGMTPRETAYWLPLLTGLFESVYVKDLDVDEQVRPFLYAVPLKGLSATGDLKSLLVGDFGIVAGELDNMFAPLISHLGADKKDPVWRPDVPKAYGIVFATEMIQAERRALDRAQFTADITNLAISAGVSHFETRDGAELLLWNAENTQATVSLQPAILLRELKSPKGWIRSVPLVDSPSLADLGKGSERIRLFMERFLATSLVGDIQDQTGRRALMPRERKLAAGVQRALRWYGIASRETNISDQFIASWVALESILDCMDYPKVFTGNRLSLRDSLLQKIDEIDMDARDTDEDQLVVTADMLKGRLLQDVWPLKKRLAMYAKAFGIKLPSSDLKLIGDLSSVRGKILHTGRDDSPVSSEQLRRLQYLIERLLMAASTGAYRDLEEKVRHKLRFGQIGPKGGFAPLTLDDRAVSYRFTVTRNPHGEEAWEFAIEGKIYDSTNSDLSHAVSDDETQSRGERD